MGNTCSRLVDNTSSSGKAFPAVRIINGIDKPITLRDREREVYGMIRLKILPNEKREVSVNMKDAGTYYRMAVLVVNELGKEEPTSPALFIESEDLLRESVITICRDTAGNHVLRKVTRTPSSGNSRMSSNV